MAPPTKSLIALNVDGWTELDESKRYTTSSVCWTPADKGKNVCLLHSTMREIVLKNNVSRKHFVNDDESF